MGQNRLRAPELERVFRGETISGLSEWQLLARYLEHRDELAFEAIVARHGPMVLGTCRRMLSGQSDVDDAFQATFLVLVRRARALGPRDAIGPWLHGVAARVSMRARSQAARRRRVETISQEHLAIAAGTFQPDGELAAVLDQEVNRLPARYRWPIVLCYLQGQTHEEAAQQLKWPLGTVKGRLSRARDILRRRLLRRGIAPALALIGMPLAREAGAAVEREFLDQTVRICMRSTLGQASAQGISVSIATLVKGALMSMIFDKLKWAGAFVLVTGVAISGAAVMARQETRRPDASSPFDAPAAKADAGSSEGAPALKAVDAALPAKSEIEGLRERLVQEARREWATTLEEFRANFASVDRAYQASRRLMNAEEEATDSNSLKAAAARHVERMRELARAMESSPSGTGTEGQRAQVKAIAAEAELWAALATTKTIKPEKSGDTSAPAEPQGNAQTSRGEIVLNGGAIGPPERGDDPRSQKVIKKLEEPVAMKFPDETPLSEIIKHIKEATRSSDWPRGIPIYVDRVGLAEAEKTLDATVSIDLEGIPLRRTLQLALAQIDLAYFVEDGLLYITSQESVDQHLLPAIPQPTPLSEKLEKAERGELSPSEMKELIELLESQAKIHKIRNAKEMIWGGVGPDPRIAAEEAKGSKELVDSLVKLTQNLLEELKEARKSKQAEPPVTPAASKATNKQ